MGSRKQYNPITISFAEARKKFIRRHQEFYNDYSQNGYLSAYIESAKSLEGGVAQSLKELVRPSQYFLKFEDTKNHARTDDSNSVITDKVFSELKHKVQQQLKVIDGLLNTLGNVDEGELITMQLLEDDLDDEKQKFKERLKAFEIRRKYIEYLRTLISEGALTVKRLKQLKLDLENMEENAVFSLLKPLAQGDDVMFHYLKKYFHQGGILNIGQTLIKTFFSTWNPNLDEIVLPDTESYKYFFTILKNGNLIVEEQFDIKGLKNTSDDHAEHKPQGGIATITLKSEISIETLDNGRRVPMHVGKDIKIIPKDESCYLLFNKDCTLWGKLKEFMNQLFSIWKLFASKGDPKVAYNKIRRQSIKF